MLTPVFVDLKTQLVKTYPLLCNNSNPLLIHFPEAFAELFLY